MNCVMHALVENFYLLQFNVERKSIALDLCPVVINIIIKFLLFMIFFMQENLFAMVPILVVTCEKYRAFVSICEVKN